MRVLVTNDDGIQAQGIEVLADAAREVFGDVTVCAPKHEQSGVSQSISLHRPLRLDELGDDRYVVDGTPVDCVFIALAHIMKTRRPELVLSGINHGPNVGYDIHYSGTVAGAREGLIHGIPAVAFSLVSRPPYAFDKVRPVVVEVLRRVRDHGLAPDTLLNVNIPNPNPEREGDWLGIPGLRGMHTTTLGRRFYGNEVVYREDPRGRPYFWIGGAWPRIEHIEGTDCESVRQGWVSVTPIGLDVTLTGALDHFRTWFTSDSLAREPR
ncbi:MAG: 5'/3'-nucleotidase SurE [Deltaproteobacteria bacterium]|nr:5'/3'-nucleotidase SurE [Deltaproteobacteria bacterium]